MHYRILGYVFLYIISIKQAPPEVLIIPKFTAMPLSVSIKHWILSSALFYILLFGCKPGKADQYLPPTGVTGTTNGGIPQSGVTGTTNGGIPQTGVTGTTNGGNPQTGATGTTVGDCPQTGAAGAADESYPQTGAGGAAGFPQTGAGGAAGFPQTGAGGAAGFPQTGAGGAVGFPQTGAGGAIPPELLSKAVQCFNDKYIYSSCNDAYRLTQSGYLNVPPGSVDQYCGGPCLQETNLVLNCIENIVSGFVFYNQATIGDVKQTIKEGCSYGPQRGDFNVAEHIQAYGGSAPKAYKPIFFGLVLIVMGLNLLI